MIGVFDSGLGGLTSVRELEKIIPNENIVYFGDTGRVPYGTRSKSTLLKYAKQDLNFLRTYDINAVLIACGTVSSIAIDALRETTDIPIVGVVEPSAKKAVETTKNKIIGVIGTGVTVASASFDKAIHMLDPNIKVVTTACPLFVPLVENGFIEKDNEITKLVAEKYLKSIKASGADTLILGCTHFPIIAGIIASVMPGVTLINSGEEAAKALYELMKEKDLLLSEGGELSYFVSDDIAGFEKTAEMFLGHSINGHISKINIEDY